MERLIYFCVEQEYLVFLYSSISGFSSTFPGHRIRVGYRYHSPRREKTIARSCYDGLWTLSL